MNVEVEVRVIVEDPEKLTRILGKIAKKIGRKRQKDIYFVPPHQDYFSEKPVTKYFRVRFLEDGSGIVAFHIVHIEDGRLKYTEEYETGVEDAGKIVEILKLAGFRERVTVVKDRTLFETDDFRITRDHVEDLGWFLEVEAKEVRSVKEARERCREFIKRLGVGFREAPQMGYPDMLLNFR